MRWLVLGGGGMLATDLLAALRDRNEDAVSVARAECDITRPEDVRRRVQDAGVVVNCAAWTGVDQAEDAETQAFAVNAIGARNVAVATQSAGARLLHLSTDYVFDGKGSRPYQPNDPQNPISAYGRTKAAGEWAVRATDSNAIVVRTAWLYGAKGPHFLTAMLRAASRQDQLSVVNDQVGQPTWTKDLAEYLIALAAEDPPGGYYHGTNSGQVSRYELTRALFRELGWDETRVTPCPTTEFPTKAERPLYSVLAHHNDGPTMPHWHDAIRRYLRETANPDHGSRTSV